MARARKTKREKIITHLRRQLSASSPTAATQPHIHLKKSSFRPAAPTQAISVSNYSAVWSDIRKTAIITTLILTGQILLYLLYFR